MTEETGIEKKGDGNEVSLVDLFAVCLRYRRLIIGLPLTAAFAAFIAGYLLPVIGIDILPKKYSVQISTSLEVFPSDLQDNLDIDVVKSMNADFSSTQFVLESYSKYFPSVIKGMKSEDILALIQNRIIPRDLSKNYDQAMAVYTLRFRGNDQESAKAFLQDLWTRSVIQIEARLAVKYVNAIELYKQQLDVYESDGKLDSASVMTKASLLGVYKKLIIYQSKPQFPFGDDPETLVVAEPGQSRSKIVLIVFLGALFVALVLVFIMNAVRDIRNDPKEMAKLQAAIKGQD